MAGINPAEVSAILKQQLANFDTQSNVEGRNRITSRRWYCSYLWFGKCTVRRISKI